jgi:hypothetical protein
VAHRGPVDRVHGRGPPLTSALASALRQRSRQHSQPQAATWHHRGLSASRPGNFTKRTPSFWKLQIYPSTYQNPHNSVLIFMSRPLISLVILLNSLPLTFYMLDLLVSHIFMFRSLKSCRKPPKLPDIHKLVPESCFSHIFSVLAPF